MLVKDVIQSVKDYCKGSWAGHKIEEATTRDKILFGDPNVECTGIVTTIYASIDVINKAHELGANLIIAHEALLWNHGDHSEWLEESENKTYLAKKQLMEEYGIVVWRFHDYIHSGIKHNGDYIDGIFYGLAQELGWQTAVCKEDLMSAVYYECETTSAKAIGEQLIKTFDLKGLKCVGNLNAKVNKILVCGHVMEGGNSNDLIKKVDKEDINLLIPLELIDYTLTEYIKDSAQLGMDRCILVPGHFNIEEPGMKYMEQWLADALPVAIPFKYVQAGDMYDFL